NDSAPEADTLTTKTFPPPKGREFYTVFLAGWEQRVFPSQRALDEGGNASLEEERRLAHVAITRARRKCFIIHAANRRIYGQWTSSIPSRFVTELPAAPMPPEARMPAADPLGPATGPEPADPSPIAARGRASAPAG